MPLSQEEEFGDEINYVYKSHKRNIIVVKAPKSKVGYSSIKSPRHLGEV